MPSFPPTFSAGIVAQPIQAQFEAFSTSSATRSTAAWTD